MNKRTRLRKTLPIRKNPAWMNADYRKLARNAETQVVHYMRRMRWIRPTQTNLTTERSRLVLLEHLPEVFAAVPDAFWSPAVHKALLNALLMIQYPHLELLPPDGQVTGLKVQSGNALRIHTRLRPFVKDTPATKAAGPGPGGNAQLLRPLVPCGKGQLVQPWR